MKLFLFILLLLFSHYASSNTPTLPDGLTRVDASIERQGHETLKLEHQAPKILDPLDVALTMSSDRITDQETGINPKIAQFEGDPNFSPYHRPYLDGESSYYAFMHKETLVVHYVPKVPEVLEVFYDGIWQETEKRNGLSKEFEQKVKEVKEKGYVTELDILDFLVYFCKTNSEEGNFELIWHSFSTQFSLYFNCAGIQNNLPLFNSDNFKKVIANATQKANGIVEIGLCKRSKDISALVAQVHKELPQGPKTVTLEKQDFIQLIRTLDKVLNIFLDIEKIINGDINDLQQRLFTKFGITINLDGLLCCNDFGDVCDVITREHSTFAYKHCNRALINFESIVSDVNEKIKQASARFRTKENIDTANAELEKVRDKLEEHTKQPFINGFEGLFTFVELLRDCDAFVDKVSKIFALEFEKNPVILERQAEERGYAIRQAEKERKEAEKAAEEERAALLNEEPEKKGGREKKSAKSKSKKHAKTPRPSPTVVQEADDDVPVSRGNMPCNHSDISAKKMAQAAFGQGALRANTNHSPAAAGCSAPKGSQQARAADRRTVKVVQKTEKAMMGVPAPVQKEKSSRVQLFAKIQPKVSDYMAMARARASKFPQIKRIPWEFFHQEEQYTFDAYIKFLSAYNVAFFKHPTENKVKVCFRGQDGTTYADNGWVYIPYGIQHKKGHNTGWFISIKKFLQRHGAVEEKQTTVEKTTE